MTGAADRLVDHALQVDWSRLPDPARQAARNFLFDTLCVGVAGRNAANAEAVLAAARSWGGTGASPVLGRPGVTLSPPYAAFVNAFQIHAQEFDCVHEAAVAHPLATVLSALLAEASRGGPYTGPEFLSAMVAGVDVVASLGVAVTSPLKFFRPATAGVFGSVGALARLRRLDRAVALNAFGYALAFASGTMQAHLEGKPALAIQVAAAARSAIEAVDLAVAGLDGPQASIDGPFGYLSLFEDTFDLDPVLSDLSRRQRIAEVSWKPFPTGRAAHGALVALQVLMKEQDVTAANLTRFVYRAPPLIVRLVGRRPLPEMTPAHARLCLPYLAAVTLLRGKVGLEDFGPEALADPTWRPLAERCVVEVDLNPDPAAFVPAEAIVTTTGGEHRQSVPRQFGAPDWPLTREEQLAKARACLAFGGLTGAEGPLTRILEGFDSEPDALLAMSSAFG